MRAAESLRALLAGPRPDYLLEAHSALAGLVAEEAGFPGVWASSLGLSAAAGCRDASELTMTQAFDALEAMSDRLSIPVLFDGDTGYGTFNQFQRLVRGLERRAIAGVCIEDQAFPKVNSLLPLARSLVPVGELCGKLRAGRDAARAGLVIVARTEAFIAGLGLGEALERAHAYAEAGADAVLVHSRAASVDEVAAFARAWDRRVPLVCVPTTYGATRPETFAELGVSIVIWANHLVRASLAAMREVARTLRATGSAEAVEDRLAPLSDLFALQDVAGLERAEKRYGAPLRRDPDEPG